MLELEGQGAYIDVLKQNLWTKLLLRAFLCVLFLLSFIFDTFNEFKQILSQTPLLTVARSPILYIYKRSDRAGIINEKHNSVGRRCKHMSHFVC